MNSKFTKIAMRATIALIFLGASYASSALENISIAQGLSACYAWCDAHNTTSNSITKCHDACFLYWECNGSDATPQSCQNAKNLVAGIPEATQGNNTPPPSQTTPPHVNPVVNQAPSAGTAALPSTSTGTSTSSLTNRAASTAVSSTLIK